MISRGVKIVLIQKTSGFLKPFAEKSSPNVHHCAENASGRGARGTNREPVVGNAEPWNHPPRMLCGGWMLASRRLRAAEDTNVFYVGSMGGAVDDVAAYTHNLMDRWAITGEC